MGKLVVSVLTSLDGYNEGPGKDLSTMPSEDAFDTHNLSLLRRAGVGEHHPRGVAGGCADRDRPPQAEGRG